MTWRRAQMIAPGLDIPLNITESEELPQPLEGWVRLRVERCGVCHRDLIDRAGRVPFVNFPVAPGHEVCGVIEAVGSAQSRWSVGERVATFHRDACGACAACIDDERGLCERAVQILGITIDGGYSNHLLAPDSALFSVPDTLDARLAATLACTYGTAWRALSRWGEPQPGDVVVVVGAHGGVGRCAVELAARLGAEVVAVVRRADDGDLRALGAAHVLVNTGDRFHRDLPTAPARIVVDCVGPATFNASLRCLGVGGRLVVVGNIDERITELQLGRIIVYGLQVVGSSGANEAELKHLLAWHAERPLRPRFAQCFGVAESEQAMAALRVGGVQGRLLIDPSLDR